MSLQPFSSTYNQFNPSSDNLNFTGLTRDQIIEELNVKFATTKFKNTTESSLAKLMLNSFAGMVDINNYNIQRRAEESFPDTAKLKSSMIGNARLLGYDIQRPVPASGVFGITITWTDDGTSLLNNEVTILPFQSFTYNSFTYNSISYINEKQLKFIILWANLTADEKTAKSYTVTPDDLYDYVIAEDKTLCKVIFPDNADDLDYSAFTLLQGETKYTKIFAGTADTNNQIGQKFQVYKINDLTFSDLYGSNDLFFDNTNPLSQKGSLTQVTITSAGTSVRDAFNDPDTCFIIDRRSLLQPELVNDYNFISPDIDSSIKVCLIRTAKDQTVELKFGDGRYTSLGLETEGDAIFIKYFSTLGAGANISYIKDDTISAGFSIVTSAAGLTGIFTWYSNSISNGLDLESNESIEINAPAIYSSLDRLITKSDYDVYLRKLGYKNVITWGESEERKFFMSLENLDSTLTKDVARRLFNVIMFCVTEPLYTAEDGNWINADTTAMISDLDPTYDPTAPFASTSKNIYNLMVNQDYISNELDGIPSNSALRTLIDNISSKSSFTIRPVYVSPFIHTFNITGTVKIDPFVNAASIRKDIQNKLYAYLNDINDFNSEIKISNLTEIINSFNGVKYSDIKLEPSETTGSTSIVSIIGLSEYGISDVNNRILRDNFNEYFTKYTTTPELYSTSMQDVISVNKTSAVPMGANGDFFTLLESGTYQLGKFTMRNFVFELVPIILNSIGYEVSDANKYAVINEFYLYLSRIIKLNMLDSNGNISKEVNSIGKWVRGGYSLGNEIVSLDMSNLQIKF
jgi:hypothetical protein